ncbi:MAG: hypothetical protein HYZ34_04010 [Ignavibacteriae bacterium]|nr:hypothetical protein [Ignavibacteriota bacterium]
MHILLCNYSQAQDTTHIVVSQGWNLISLPIEPAQSSVTELFPNAVSKAFYYDGQYIAMDTLRPEIGYWLKFAQSETIMLTGKQISCHVFTLRSGWNLIGTPGEQVGVNDLKTSPEGILATGFYGYDSIGYTIVDDSLLPGHGYWVKSRQRGTMLIPFSKYTPPILISPADSSDYQSTYPLFTWSEIQCKNFYYLQVSQDSTFTSAIYDDSLLD